MSEVQPGAVAVADAPDPADEPQVVESVPEALVEEELLVEDISIDGMCGVY